MSKLNNFTNVKNTINILVVSSEAENSRAPAPKQDHLILKAVNQSETSLKIIIIIIINQPYLCISTNISDLVCFYYLREYELMSSDLIVVYTFHSAPTKLLSKWWNAGGGRGIAAVSSSLGDSNICPKPMSLVKIFMSRSKVMERRTDRRRPMSRTAKQHSETSHGHCFFK